MRACTLERFVALTVAFLILAPERLPAESKSQQEIPAAAASHSQAETGVAQRQGTDRPQPRTPKTFVVRTFVLKKVHASVVADVIKDLYRDLLIANEKARVEKREKQPFRRPLSVDSDNKSNTIRVVCSRNMMNNIEHLVEALERGSASRSR
jgi:hypothetical protein